MDIEPAASDHKKAGLFARGWSWLKALPEKLKAKVVEVANKVRKIGQDDPRRIAHALKVGLALTLVSLIYYYRPLYDGFGISGMWAVLTVVVVFEFSVGATLGKGLNRGFATLLAGALGVGAHYLSSLCGNKGEPIVLGLSVFLLAAASTFSRFIPGIKKRYDYGVVIFILTFSLVSVSGYRVDKIIELAHQRLSTIVIGSLICVIISFCIMPVWAGEDLHNLVAQNLEKLATFLEGFGGEFFKNLDDGEIVVVSGSGKSLADYLKNSEGETGSVSKSDKSFLQKYKSILTSKATEDSLANFARWEPGHGRFKFRHPWKQYLNIAGLARQCAYLLEALNGYINTEIQRKIQDVCVTMSSESGKALMELSAAIKAMTHPSLADLHVENCKNAARDLKTTLKTALLENSDLLGVIPSATVASLLVDVVVCTEKIAESVHELAKLAHFKTVEPTVTPEKSQLLHRGTVNPLAETDSPEVVITITAGPSEALPEGANPRAPVTGKHVHGSVNICD
ncbi:PREDICTED: aluminum-activated malate transporter 8 isoform X2 [Nelumbo nucifera]|uniref:Aluminum-activated malate transporter 8 isoform X2 n=1 Tax=Nelumbo nucifera TaxID=4432 RepID=A0A1U7Z4I8_NELNU|nr:PREDICTED: aluminum-activated malate transporter 8 isoform X2 [Nelumbo nucifera]